MTRHTGNMVSNCPTGDSAEKCVARRKFSERKSFFFFLQLFWKSREWRGKLNGTVILCLSFHEIQLATNSLIFYKRNRNSSKSGDYMLKFVINEKSIGNFRIRCQQSAAATYPMAVPTNHTKRRVLYVGLLFSQGTTSELIPVCFPRRFLSISYTSEAVQACGCLRIYIYICEYGRR